MICTDGKFFIAISAGLVIPLVTHLVLLLCLELLIAILMNLKFADDIGQTLLYELDIFVEYVDANEIVLV